MIKQTAIKDNNGKVWTLPRPNRHHHIIRYMYANGMSGSFMDGQGFILEDDTFVSREEAAKIALDCGQVETLKAPPDLYSEDLW